MQWVVVEHVWQENSAGVIGCGRRVCRCLYAVRCLWSSYSATKSFPSHHSPFSGGLRWVGHSFGQMAFLPFGRDHITRYRPGLRCGAQTFPDHSLLMGKIKVSHSFLDMTTCCATLPSDRTLCVSSGLWFALVQLQFLISWPCRNCTAYKSAIQPSNWSGCRYSFDKFMSGSLSSPQQVENESPSEAKDSSLHRGIQKMSKLMSKMLQRFSVADWVFRNFLRRCWWAPVFFSCGVFGFLLFLSMLVSVLYMCSACLLQSVCVAFWHLWCIGALFFFSFLVPPVMMLLTVMFAVIVC